MDKHSHPWVKTFPELATRPKLLEELKVNNKLRNSLFSLFNTMGAAASLSGKDKKAANRLLQYSYRMGKVEVQNSFQSELESRDYLLYNELMGCLKNVMLNLTLCNGYKPWSNGARSHTVVRSRQKEKPYTKS